MDYTNLSVLRKKIVFEPYFIKVSLNSEIRMGSDYSISRTAFNIL